jgi:hypothetical protein
MIWHEPLGSSRVFEALTEPIFALCSDCKSLQSPTASCIYMCANFVRLMRSRERWGKIQSACNWDVAL